MSVVSAAARRRWATVAVGVVALIAVPSGVSATVEAMRDDVTRLPVSELVERARASGSVAFTAQAQSRGNLGLPDLPRLGDVAARLGGTTDTRVWWAGEAAWRVDVLTPTGEEGTYAFRGLLLQWDYESNQRTVSEAVTDGVRLPRADDLLPPAIARRFLGGVGPGDVVTARPGTRRVAGRTALGLRLTPGDRRSTIGHVDIWMDPGSGLPLAVQAVGTNGGTALDTSFSQVSLRAPAAAVLRPPPAPGSTLEREDQPDIVSRLQRFGRWRLPATLAGLRSTTPVATGAGTYGPGLTRIVVVPLPPRLAGDLVSAGQEAGGKVLELPGGPSVLIRSGALSAAVVGGPGDAPGWAVAGLVTPETIEAAATTLAEHPPSQEFS